MIAEVGIPLISALGILPLAWISYQQKEEIRKQNPLYGEKSIQVGHIIPRYKGGTDDPTNLEGVTVSEHFEYHKESCEEALEENNLDVAIKERSSAYFLTAFMLPRERKRAQRELADIEVGGGQYR